MTQGLSALNNVKPNLNTYESTYGQEGISQRYMSSFKSRALSVLCFGRSLQRAMRVSVRVSVQPRNSFQIFFIEAQRVYEVHWSKRTKGEHKSGLFWSKHMKLIMLTTKTRHNVSKGSEVLQGKNKLNLCLKHTLSLTTM